MLDGVFMGVNDVWYLVIVGGLNFVLFFFVLWVIVVVGVDGVVGFVWFVVVFFGVYLFVWLGIFGWWVCLG